MINRIWRGWTSSANADAYQQLLEREIAPGIAGRGIAGVRGPRLPTTSRSAPVEASTRT